MLQAFQKQVLIKMPRQKKFEELKNPQFSNSYMLHDGSREREKYCMRQDILNPVTIKAIIL
jgi:hypothetical protein